MKAVAVHCKREIQCQACDRPLRFNSEADLEEKMQTWAVHRFPHPIATTEILVCPKCAPIEPRVLMTRFQKRVSSGRDLGYH